MTSCLLPESALALEESRQNNWSACGLCCGMRAQPNAHAVRSYLAANGGIGNDPKTLPAGNPVSLKVCEIDRNYGADAFAMC